MIKRHLSLTFLVIALSAISTHAVAKPEPLDRIIAVADDEIILKSEFDKEYARILKLIATKGGPLPPIDVLRRQVGERLVVQKIQLKRAKKMGVRVDDTQLNDTLLEKARRNKMTLVELKNSLERQGLSYKAYRESLREELILKQAREYSIMRSITVTEQEVDDFLAQNPIGNENGEYRIKHLLINVDENAKPKAIAKIKAKVEELRTKVLNGSDFSELARAHSDGQRAKQGGDLGWLPRARIPSLFSRTVDRLNDGEISEAIRSPSGFHLIFREASRGEEKRIIQQVKVRHILLKPDIVESMEAQKKQITRLRKRILAGESFSTLAKTYSDDEGSAVDGGEMGWTSPKLFVKEFRNAVNTLPLNTLSEPVKTQYGWHILEVRDKRRHDETADARRNVARKVITERKSKEEEILWIQRLRDSAYVEYYWDDIKPEVSAEERDATRVEPHNIKDLTKDRPKLDEEVLR